MELGVFIVNYFSTRSIRLTLESLVGQWPSFVWIADNSVDEDEFAILERIRRDFADVGAVEVRRSPGNVGLNDALSQARDARSWDAALLLNPDATVAPGCLDALRDAHLAAPKALLSPVITFADDENKRRLWWAGGRVDLRRGRVVHDGYG